jgi:hypothetical protein
LRVIFPYTSFPSFTKIILSIASLIGSKVSSWNNFSRTESLNRNFMGSFVPEGVWFFSPELAIINLLTVSCRTDFKHSISKGIKSDLVEDNRRLKKSLELCEELRARGLGGGSKLSSLELIVFTS